MIGVFDSGHGGLTVFRALARRFPRVPFVYFGDHRNVPYGNRPSDEIVALTRDGVDALFRRGCRLVLLGCNTATCVAARTLQKDWLPVSGWTGRNILGIVAPTVEAATQTPWAVTTPQYPQKYNADVIAVFGTTRTIASHAYPDFHLLMPLYVCRKWSGIVTALEGQQLKWVRPAGLGDYPMPPADKPLVAMLRDLL